MNRERSARYAAVAIVVVIVIVVAALALYPRHFEVTLEGEGSVSVSEGDVNAIEGETVSIVPADGWFIASVTVDGKPVTTDDGNVTIETSLFDLSSIAVHIVFSEMPVEPAITHTVTITHTDGGDVTPSGAVVVEDGGSLTIRFKPDPGYRTSTMTLDGESVSANGSLTLDDIVEDHSVHVVFARTQTPDGGGEGTSTPGLVSIAITDPADKLVYSPGDIFDPSGMSILATYDDGSTRNVTSDCEFVYDDLTDVGIHTVIVTHTHNGKTASCEFDILVASSSEFNTLVTSYYGTRTTDGKITEFSEKPNIPLSEFDFQTEQMIPGMSQTITVSISNLSGATLEAHVMIQNLDRADRELAEQLTLKVSHDGASITESILDLADGGILSISNIPHGGTETVEITLSFPERADNNEAMGQSVGFTLGIFADMGEDI